VGHGVAAAGDAAGVRRVARGRADIPGGTWLAPCDLTGPLFYAVGLAADPAPVISTVYQRYGVAQAASCCKELTQGHEPGRRHLAKIVLDDLGTDFHEAILSILREEPGSPREAAQLPEEASFAELLQAWEGMPRKGTSADSRGRALEKFAVTLLGTYFEVIEIRQRRQGGEVDVICENLNSDPFWANYPGDIWVECKNTDAKATLEQVNTFLGKLMGAAVTSGSSCPPLGSQKTPWTA
jgi:hypothetical protein